MGEGQDKIARSLLNLEPTAILDLFLVYPDYNGQPDEVFAIHNGSLFKKGVIWQGVTYMPIGLEMDGFEINADGRINRPKIKVSNNQYFVTSLLKKYNNFQSARIVKKRTLVKYLDDDNFDGGNPFGQSDASAELSSQEYIVAQKTQENKVFVEFELTSPLDLDNFQLNHRRIMGKYCYWSYRGLGCRYEGPPIHRENGKNFQDLDGNPVSLDVDSFVYGDKNDEYSEDKQYEQGDIAYIKINSQTSQDSSSAVSYNYYVAKTEVRGLRPDENLKYWDKDGCNKKLSSCKVHFPEGGVINRFVGLGTSQIDTARFIPETKKAHVLRPQEFIYTDPAGTDPILKMRQKNQWTLAFNLKQIQQLDYRNAIFRTLWNNPSEGSLYTDNPLELIIDDNSFVFAFEEDLDGVISSKKITSSPRLELQDGLVNHPILIGQKDDKTLFLYEPSLDSYVEYSLNGTLRKNRISNFYIGADEFNATIGSIRSTRMDIDSICLWSKAITKAEIQRLYNKPVDGGLRAKRYQDIPQGDSLLEDVENWWQDAFTGDTEINPPTNLNGLTQFDGIRDLKQQNSLILDAYYGVSPIQPEDEAFEIDTNSYEYNIEEQITIGGEGKLPFGGFPGTDGFDFSRGA